MPKKRGVTRGSGNWRKTLVCHQEPLETRVEEILDLTRKLERLEKSWVRNKI